MVLQLTVFWYIGAVLGHVCLGLGVLALVTMLLSWVFFFPQWGLGVCVVLWSVGCKSIQFLVHSFNQPKPLWVWHPSPLVTDRSREAMCSSFSGSIPPHCRCGLRHVGA